MTAASPRRYFKELRFRQLRAFCLTAHAGSFAAAADTLGMSRPALWHQVRALEGEFEADLVRLRGRRVELTAEGQLLFDLAAPVVEGFATIKDLFAERRNRAPRTLSIATTASLLSNELRPALIGFQGSHPHVRVRFLEGPSRECVRRLEAGDVELAFFGHLGLDPMPPRLHLSPIGRYPVVVVHAETSPLAEVRRLDARELVQHSLILPAPDTSARHILDGFFTKAGVNGRLRIALEAQNAIQFAHADALKLGAIVTTISPLRLLELERHAKSLGVVIREMPGAGHEEIHCARRVGHGISPAAADFLKLVLNDAEGFLRRPLQGLSGQAKLSRTRARSGRVLSPART
jgi:DNA-binding transcriptional LysR family regulator